MSINQASVNTIVIRQVAVFIGVLGYFNVIEFTTFLSLCLFRITLHWGLHKHVIIYAFR